MVETSVVFQNSRISLEIHKNLLKLVWKYFRNNLENDLEFQKATLWWKQITDLSSFSKYDHQIQKCQNNFS